MAFLGIEQLPGEAIFVLKYQGEFTLQDFVDSYAACVARWDDCYRETGVYLLTDMRAVDNPAGFGTVLEMVRAQAAQDAAIMDLLQHVRQYIISEHPMTKLYANLRAQPQFGGVTLPMYVNLEDAIEAARTAIKNRVSAQE